MTQHETNSEPCRADPQPLMGLLFPPQYYYKNIYSSSGTIFEFGFGSNMSYANILKK